jgi:RNA-binding protein
MSRKTKKKDSAKSGKDAKEAGPRPAQRALTAAERKKLRGLAQALRPLVQLGREGLSAGALREIDRGLESHELVKVRLDSGREERPALALRIAEATGAGVAGTVGQVVILFRQRVDPEERRVELGSDLYAPAG